MWNHRVEEAQGEGTALNVRTGGGHVGVVQAEIGTPGLEAGFTRLLHIRGAWHSEHSHFTLSLMTLNHGCGPGTATCLGIPR